MVCEKCVLRKLGIDVLLVGCVSFLIRLIGLIRNVWMIDG